MNALLAEAEKADRTGADPRAARSALKADFERIARWFDDDFDRDGARGLAVFAAGLDNFWSTVPLPRAPCRTASRSAASSTSAPLVPLVARADGTIVAVVGREQGQLYRLRAGRLEEIADHFDGAARPARPGRLVAVALPAAHREARPGAPEGRRRGARPQPAADARRRRSCSSAPRRCARSSSDELSKEARDALSGWRRPRRTPGRPSCSRLCARARAGAGERRGEVIERWREEAGRNGRAAPAGSRRSRLRRTAASRCCCSKQASTGRRSVSGVRPGGRCPGEAARSTGPGSSRTDAGLDLAVHQTLAHGGAVWAIRHHEDLGPVEGIGALLRGSEP